MKSVMPKKLKGPVPVPVKTPTLPPLAKDALKRLESLEQRVDALEAITQPAIIFQLSYNPFGGELPFADLPADAISMPASTVRMLLNFNILVLFRKADTYLFAVPTFSCDVWEPRIYPSEFTTTGPAFNQVIALGIETNNYSPHAAKPGDTVTMTLKVTSKTDPTVTAQFVQNFKIS